MKKIFISLLMILISLPLISFNSVKADTVLNRSIILDNMSIEPLLAVTSIPSNRFIQFDDTAAYYNWSSPTYDGASNTYSLILDHVYYWATEISFGDISSIYAITYSNGTNILQAGSSYGNVDVRVFTSTASLDANLNYYRGSVDYFTVSGSVLIDLTLLYGSGNEPSISEVGRDLYDASITDGYINVYDDSDDIYSLNTDDGLSYFTVDDETDFYQYKENMYGVLSKVVLTFYETLIQDSTPPELYIAKYDLNGNLIGTLIDEYISLSGQNVDGFNYYDYTYNLPSPLSSEVGYGWVAYNGVDGNVLDAGYVFDETSNGFSTALTDVRSITYAVGINDSPYNNISNDYQMDRNNMENYIYNNDNPMILHYRASRSAINADAVTLSFYFENDSYSLDISLNDLHSLFHYSGSSLVVESFLMFSADDDSPPLIELLETQTVFNDMINNILDNYNSYMNNFLSTDIVDNDKGFYTYSLEYDNGATIDHVAIGESPLYFVNEDLLYDFYLSNDSIRVGNHITINIDKFNENIDDIYGDQYIYDDNTLSSYDEIIMDYPNVEITYNLVEAYAVDSSFVRYYLINNQSYDNGADLDAYDIYFNATYDIRVYRDLDIVINDTIDDFGFNTDASRVLLSIIVMFLLSLFLIIAIKMTFIVVLIVDFVLYSLLAILGFVPLYTLIVLLLVIILLVINTLRRG